MTYCQHYAPQLDSKSLEVMLAHQFALLRSDSGPLTNRRNGQQRTWAKIKATRYDQRIDWWGHVRICLE